MRLGKLRWIMALVALGVLAAGVPSRMLQAAGRLAGKTDASIPAEPAFVAEEKPNLQPAMELELALATAQAPKPPAPPAQEAPPQDSLGDPAKKPQAEVESIPPATTAAPSTCTPCKPKCCAKPCAPRRPLLARLGRCCRPVTCCGRGLLRRR